MTSRMKIYRLIAMMLLICASPKSSAEKKAQIKVGYEYEVKIGDGVRKDNYILLSGAQNSMFYNPTALWMDINSKDDAACQAYGAMAAALQEAGRGD